MVTRENLSLKCVNSTNCTLKLMLEEVGGLIGKTILLYIVGMVYHNIALDWHLCCMHVHSNSHGSLYSGGL